MEITRKHILNILIKNNSDIGTCRRKAVSLAKGLEFDEIKIGEIAIIVTELVTNVIKHGGQKGELQIYQINNPKQQKALEIWCYDKGKGIPDFEKAVADGFTDKKSLGIGLGSVRRFSNEFEINPKQQFISSESDSSRLENYSNCIRVLKWVPSKLWISSNRKLTTGAASRCHPGEQLNGDAYLINHISSEKTVVAVIDGLGHGKEAHIASQLAKEQLIQRGELPAQTLMNYTHSSIQGTRGAVMGLAIIDTGNNKLSFTGIGNIEGFIKTPENKKTLLSFGGIIGHNMRTPRTFEFDFKPGDFLCLFSDGITSRWNSNDINWENHAQQNAEYILNNHSRQNDDATILIVHYNS